MPELEFTKDVREVDVRAVDHVFSLDGPFQQTAVFVVPRKAGLQAASNFESNGHIPELEIVQFRFHVIAGEAPQLPLGGSPGRKASLG